MQSLLSKIVAKYNLVLKDYKPLSGSALNHVFKITTNQADYFVKLNNSKNSTAMFHAEALGLELLRTSKSFIIPKVIGHGTIEEYGYLLIDFISQEKPSQDFWETFANNLVKLHKTSQENFGLDHDNFIAYLPQHNSKEELAVDFYIKQRLKPQFNLAKGNGYDFGDLNSFYGNISGLIPEEKPSLLHGDLWNGNFLISENGTPVLIDPAVCFGNREMDIAMMHLFGGFPSEVFKQYHSTFPLVYGWEDRIPLFQLYYILVHVNLFGGSYFHQAKEIVNRFS
ncbi:fructosamine kinase family protein [Patiriisocius hiemis]|uniref:Fructosamine kinase family protein n=1 Tax=Patiriisocius hiemis TaxID=3075604 RepID=A0ABU2YCH4_9FLAO|nr:fructosamine kinase family protein [Constantimarinum sp. W242]MDT0555889.1 fructosamine kinase family protein [Constantimarinum sp. W242]